MSLKALGFDEHFRKCFAPYKEKGLFAGRVVREESNIYRVISEHGELRATVSGRLWYHAEARSEFPAIGDWVALRVIEAENKAKIVAILDRKSCFSRKEAGTVTREQIIAANVDVLFIVTGLDRDFNVRRLERYLLLCSNSGANPVVVLNKSDLCHDEELMTKIGEARACAPGTPVIPVSALEGSGLESMQLYLEKGQTGALVGSSGVGKSALINALLGRECQLVGEVREADGRGRHTTTHRELFTLPEGGLLIDSPGMRELQLWTEEDSLELAFSDIEELAQNCRFRDCQHQGEPGCAVHQALEEGTLAADRFDSYLQLQKETRYLARRQDQKARQEEQAKWRRISRQIRKMKIRR